MPKRILSAAASVIVLLGSEAPAQDLARGQEKAARCAACHGPSGVAPNPTFPHLAGQNASYLEMQLQNFRSGERYHPLMTPIAEELSREDINDLAAFFSSIGPLAGTAR